MIGEKILTKLALFRSFCVGFWRMFCALAVCISSIFCTINYAVAADEDYVFFVTITDLPANTNFTFTISAKGTFYIDCDGGTLYSSSSGIGTQLSGNRIIRNDHQEEMIWCKYTTGGSKRIRFGGSASTSVNDAMYNSNGNVSAISFDGDACKYISEISGDLSAMFPYISSNNYQHPNFYHAFHNCSKLTSLPSTLFASYSGNMAGATRLFDTTFQGCTGLTSLPNGLFSGITINSSKPADGSSFFKNTFKDCSNLTGFIPPDFFANLIKDGSQDYTDFMKDIFDGDNKMDTQCPENYYQYETGYENYFGGRVSCEACPQDAPYSPSGSTDRGDCSANVVAVVTYDCGSGTGGGTVNVNSGSSYTVNGVVGGVDNCSAPTPNSNYEFFAWYCTNSASSSAMGSVAWYDNPISVLTDYGSSYTIYATQSATMTINENMTCVAIWLKKNVCDPGTMTSVNLIGQDWNQDALPGIQDNHPDHTGYGVNFSYGMVDIGGQCSVTPGVPGVAGNPDLTTPNGQYCWCHLVGYEPANGIYQPISNGPWVFDSVYADDCQNSACEDACGRHSAYGSSNPSIYAFSSVLRHGLFVANTCQYTVTYDCETNNGTFTSGGTYAAAPHTMSVIAGGNYTISNATSVCTPPNGGYDFDTSGQNTIAGGWVCTADNGGSPAYIGSANVSGTWSYNDNYTCVAQYVQNVPTQYNVMYNCDNPYVSNPANTPVTIGSQYSLTDASVCGPYTGYHLNLNGTIGGGWVCSPVVNGTVPSPLPAASGVWPSTAISDYTCTAQWVQNTIFLDWVDPMNSIDTSGFSSDCLYMSQNTISLLYQSAPERPGFTFNGWIVTDWDECGLKSANVKSHFGDGMDDFGWCDLNGQCEGAFGESLGGDQTWALSFPYGRVYGQALCNNDEETAIDDGYGPVCWCRLTGFEPNGGDMCELTVSNQWVRLPDYDGDSCKTNCVQGCVNTCGNSGEENEFRMELYGWN